MHREILSKEQLKLLPLLRLVKRRFSLVGGTAVALHIGHRRSIDFDLFTDKKFANNDIKKVIAKVSPITQILVNRMGEYTFFCGKVKITFFEFPFSLTYKSDYEGFIKMPDLLTLAAMKAYALGQRNKWKDYVDLYFIIRDYHTLEEVISKGKEIFGREFNSKIFRTQLGYFNDINYREEVEFLPGFEVKEKEIKKALVKFSLV